MPDWHRSTSTRESEARRVMLDRLGLQGKAAGTRRIDAGDDPDPRRDTEAAQLDRDHRLHPLQHRRVRRAQRAETEDEVHLVGVGQADRGQLGQVELPVDPGQPVEVPRQAAVVRRVPAALLDPGAAPGR